MKHPNAFALQNAGFNAFLFAEVGTELNGSTLTVLSVLARLGDDPWEKAASLAALPRADAVQRLAQSIARMPLNLGALQDIPATAARLALLLPAPRSVLSVNGEAAAPMTLPKWLPMTFLYVALAIGLAVNVVLAERPAPAPAAPLTTHTT